MVQVLSAYYHLLQSRPNVLVLLLAVYRAPLQHVIKSPVILPNKASSRSDSVGLDGSKALAKQTTSIHHVVILHMTSVSGAAFWNSLRNHPRDHSLLIDIFKNKLKSFSSLQHSCNISCNTHNLNCFTLLVVSFYIYNCSETIKRNQNLNKSQPTIELETKHLLYTFI